MVLKNHIATKFLSSHIIALEIIKKMEPEEYDKWFVRKPSELMPYFEGNYSELPNKIWFMLDLLTPDRQKAFYVTDTVLDKFEMVKIDKLDWKIFKQAPDGKFTFIMDGNNMIRMKKETVTLDDGSTMNLLQLCFMTKINEEMRFYFYNFDLEDGKELETKGIGLGENPSGKRFTYLLLCFMFLTDNDEVEVPPGRKAGTKKSGKLINTLGMPVTIVNSRWNTTVIRNEGFEVSGHFRLQPVGIGRSETKLIFIEPFQKHGYMRRAKSVEAI